MISFAPFSREQAFGMTVTSFVETLRRHPQILRDGEWVVALFRQGVAECMQTAPQGVGDFKKEPLKIIREAFFQLSPADKVVLLLRDQCHLPFESLAAILGMEIPESRSVCLAARERFRAIVKEILDKPPEDSHVV